MTEKTMVGVDVAKLTFDARWRDNGKIASGQFENSEAGFEQLIQLLPSGAHIVMEVTGTYHLRLATWLYRKGYPVSVENPAKPAYFARMQMRRAKTDPVDTQVLLEYGEYRVPTLWRPEGEIFAELNQLDRHLTGLQSDLNRTLNRLEGLAQRVSISEFARADLISQAEDLKLRIKASEREITRLVLEHFMELYTLMQSIPGVGKKTAVMFIVLTEAFTRFPDAKRFTSYLGMTSFIKQSGTSIRVKGGITKMGSNRMRQILYMAALTAKRQNKACVDFAARLTANGKPAKVVRIAVANKLIRQIFAVIEKQEPYSEKYA